MFSLFVSLFVYQYTRRTVSPLAAVALGLAAATNVLVFIPYTAMALHRYIIQRRFELRRDALFHAILAILATPLILNTLRMTAESRAGQFAVNRPVAFANGLLGYVGGMRIGMGFAYLALPSLAAFAIAMALWLFRRQPQPVEASDEPSRTVLFFGAWMSLLAGAMMLAAGFEKTRSFLFLAPFHGALLAYVALRPEFGRERRLVLPLQLITLVSTLVLFNGFGDRPYKRNLSIPFDQVTSIVRPVLKGKSLLISSEPVSYYLLRHDISCAVLINENRPANCAAATPGSFDTVVVISAQQFEDYPDLVAADRRFTLGMRSAGRWQVGFDKDAALKNRLTHSKLSPRILDIEVYAKPGGAPGR